MKHIFKKLHFGSSGTHESTGRSQEVSATASSSSSSSSTSAQSPSVTCGSTVDHRLPSSAAAAVSPTFLSPSPSPTSPVDASLSVADRQNYFTSEEEFQVQLALAISASNSEFREDPHNDQIRAATLLSLGKRRDDYNRQVDDTAETLSRRYWDYNVLDYDEKVVDGFYDIFALSSDPARHGKMPSLSDLQTNIGDLGFEVILVNRAIDRSLQELEQVAQCISLDSQCAEIGILVQRLADVVTEHMGGPVRDANDMLAKWMERSTTLRVTLQTSLIPIGGVNVGLSRHRALLFKVLADKVGIPCKLVKGSHYTGIDDDAVNIIKVDNDREFLVDLMAAPGILIPADVLSTGDSSTVSLNSRLSNPTSWAKNVSSSGVSNIEALEKAGGDRSKERNSGMSAGKLLFEKDIATSFPSSSDGSLPSSSGSCSNEDKRNHLQEDQPNQSLVASDATFLHSANLDMSMNSDVSEKHDAFGNLQENIDPKDPFADLNPFLAMGVGKMSSDLKTTEKRINGFQRRRENISSGPGRPPLPLVWKNRSACNEVPYHRSNVFCEGLFPLKNAEANDVNTLSSSTSASPMNIYPENSKINFSHISGSSYSHGVGAATEVNDSTCENFISNPIGDETRPLPRTNQRAAVLPSDHENVRADRPVTSVKFSEDVYQETGGINKMFVQVSTAPEQEDGKNFIAKHERRKYNRDRFTSTNMILRDSNQPRPDRLDPMLDDVAEWEIPWEDLVIGERIGLGSYGEVYHAEWNGTEVAVKKFLDQDFYGDALDEFRSEVRIMRRLRHPNVVLFMGAVMRPPNLSIVTEFLPRGSLYRILHRPNCQIEQKRRIKMALDVAKGMNCLHTSTPTIVHRDLKSPNLLVDKNWNVKVCDFGLSRLKHNTFLSSKSTAGTPEWMAPEVLRNEQSNEKCDVYSFGVILWELATLRMPWSGMNPMQVVGAVGFQNRRLEIPNELDPLVARIIWECWQTDPSLRPSFAQLTSALKPLQQLVTPSSHEDSQSPSLPTEISVNSTP